MARIDQDMWFNTINNFYPDTTINSALRSFDAFTRADNRDFLAFAKSMTDYNVTDSINSATYMWGYVNRLADLKVEQKAKADLDALREKLVGESNPYPFTNAWWEKYGERIDLYAKDGLKFKAIKEARKIIQEGGHSILPEGVGGLANVKSTLERRYYKF